MRHFFSLNQRRVSNVLATLLFLLAAPALALAETNTTAGLPLNGHGNNNPPPSENLDSVHQRGSTDFSDMGSWIWATNTFDRQTVRFWKSFQVPADGGVSRARLRITGDNEYTLYLDGRELGRDAEWRHLYEYDITELLTPGPHVLAVEVYNSFNEAGMVLGLRVGLKNGTIIEVKSDSSWLLVPEGIKDWEKTMQPVEGWQQAKIEVPFGSQPWGKLDTIDVVPPMQPLIIPFWKQEWFQILLLIICAGATLISLGLMTQLIVHKKEKELLLRERARIARDIHDDLGLRVTQLVLEGEIAQSESLAGSVTRGQFEKISDEAREALRAMDEILWAINPRRDTLREFATYFCKYAQTILKASPIQCVLDVEPNMSSATFDLPLRRNLLLAAKEALNNALKHSRASLLFLAIRRQNDQVILILEDDGRGFDPSEDKSERNGLTNMAQRMAGVGGLFKLTSHPGKGCRVEFRTPLVLLRPRFSWLNRPFFNSVFIETAFDKDAIPAVDKTKNKL